MVKKGVSTDKNHINRGIDMNQILRPDQFHILAFLALQKIKRAKKAPGSEIQAWARAVSFDRGRSKRTFAMLMLSAGKLAFKAKKENKTKIKRC